MAEHLAPAAEQQEFKAPQVEAAGEIIKSQTESTLGLMKAPEVTPEEEAAQKTTAMRAAEQDVTEAIKRKGIEDVVGTLDFSPEKFDFFAVDSYQAQATTQAKTGGPNTRHEGKGEMIQPQYYDKQDLANRNKWGNPSQEAHLGGQPIEKVGIQVGSTEVWSQTEKKLPIPGWRGKLGFKRLQKVPELKTVEPQYRFDYEFAAPSHSDNEAALDAGNRTGQKIRLSLKLTKEQAEDLSAILKEDPKMARTVLDKFVAATNGNGMWEADVFDEEGKFHDPGERYGTDFVARDVRPRYEAVPELQPEIVGLIDMVDGKKAPTTEKPVTEEGTTEASSADTYNIKAA